jgi:5'-nucleotidase
MKNYLWVMFDADDTLFEFNAYAGLKTLLGAYRLPFNEDDFQEYQSINRSLWHQYHQGSIDAETLKTERFRHISEKINIPPTELNRQFLNVMVTHCNPAPGAISLLNALKQHCALGIITNGFSQLQYARLKFLGLQHVFKLLIISEQVGVAKPHIHIFQHALEQMDQPKPSQVLMVGDNPDTDIRGGQAAGFDTCWLNVNHKKAPPLISPTYQVTSLTQLEAQLCGDLNPNLCTQANGLHIEEPT